MRIEGERMQQDSYVETSRFFSVSRSIATPFLCFFSLSLPLSSYFSLFLPFRISWDAVYLELCIPTRLCTRRCTKGGRRTSEMQIGGVEQVKVRSRWKLRNSISILEQRLAPFLLCIPLQLSWTCQEEDFLPYSVFNFHPCRERGLRAIGLYRG